MDYSKNHVVGELRWAIFGGVSQLVLRKSIRHQQTSTKFNKIRLLKNGIRANGLFPGKGNSREEKVRYRKEWVFFRNTISAKPPKRETFDTYLAPRNEGRWLN